MRPRAWLPDQLTELSVLSLSSLSFLSAPKHLVAATMLAMYPVLIRIVLESMRGCLKIWLIASISSATLATASKLSRIKVEGSSMEPAISAGDRLLVLLTSRIRPGDAVVAYDPRDPTRKLVKRAAAVEGNLIYLLGDNTGRSTDSRVFGWVDRRHVIGRICYRYSPPTRAGRISNRYSKGGVLEPRGG